MCNIKLLIFQSKCVEFPPQLTAILSLQMLCQNLSVILNFCLSFSLRILSLVLNKKHLLALSIKYIQNPIISHDFHCY